MMLSACSAAMPAPVIDSRKLPLALLAPQEMPILMPNEEGKVTLGMLIVHTTLLECAIINANDNLAAIAIATGQGET